MTMSSESTFAKQFRRSRNKIDTAVRFCLLWLAQVDGEFHDTERRAIDVLWGRGQGDEPAEAVLLEAVQAQRVADLTLVFDCLRRGLANDSRLRMIELAIELVVADSRVSLGERHALCFLADVLGVEPVQLEAAFRERTGLSLLPIGDPSSSQWWNEQARAGRGASGGATGRDDRGRNRDSGEQQHAGAQRGSDSTLDPTLVAALATLGLMHPVTVEEIKQAYRRLAAAHHPDKFHALGESAVAAATRTFARIQSAYETALRATP